MNHQQAIVETQNKTGALKTILLAGLVAGVLDGIAAVVSTYIVNGVGPDVVWKFVASGVFGIKTAMAGGAEMIIAGLIFHMIIATIWAALFFAAYPFIRKIPMNKYVIGLLYGIIVWLGMNLIVVPLSNTPQMEPKTIGSIRGILILMFCIGLPVSLIVSRYFERTRQK
jgi:hypothetical protein